MDYMSYKYGPRKLSYHHRDMYQVIRVLNYGNPVWSSENRNQSHPKLYMGIKVTSMDPQFGALFPCPLYWGFRDMGPAFLCGLQRLHGAFQKSGAPIQTPKTRDHVLRTPTKRATSSWKQPYKDSRFGAHAKGLWFGSYTKAQTWQAFGPNCCSL